MVDLPRSDQVRGVLHKFTNEEQDPAVVEQVYSKVSEILTSGEEIRYIAVQKKLGLNVSPDAVILTNKRFIKYKSKMLGRVDFEDYIWRDLHDVHVKEGMRGATLKMKTTDGHKISIDDLPKSQARRLYSLAQNIEEDVAEERRQRELEEKRAAAGGITMQTATPIAPQPVPQPAPQQDPMGQLTKLKSMVDAGLITEEEYNTKKAEILANM
jgi:Bacterial PH domain/Short C-terminal domain